MGQPVGFITGRGGWPGRGMDARHLTSTLAKQPEQSFNRQPRSRPSIGPTPWLHAVRVEGWCKQVAKRSLAAALVEDPRQMEGVEWTGAANGGVERRLIHHAPLPLAASSPWHFLLEGRWAMSLGEGAACLGGQVKCTAHSSAKKERQSWAIETSSPGPAGNECSGHSGSRSPNIPCSFPFDGDGDQAQWEKKPMVVLGRADRMRTFR
jgi:hypothetical protein